MINFEKNLGSKESLGIGNSSWFDKKMAKVIRDHVNNESAPVVIHHIEVTENKDIRIYFFRINEHLDFYFINRYWHERFIAAECNHIIDFEDPTYDGGRYPEGYRHIEYPVKSIYKHSLESGRVYTPKDKEGKID